MNHTPGPWNYHHHVEILKGGELDFYTIRSAENICLAEINRIDGATRNQDDANARLIAAAPELLDALRAALDSLEYWFKRNGDTEGCNSEQMKTARELIKITEG